MTRNRFAKSLAAATGFVLLCVIPGLTFGQSTPSPLTQTARTASAATQSKGNSDPQNDFAGINFTDDQKAAIARIHHDTESHKAMVMKDASLNDDQKNALLVGYTRIEYGQMFRVLSPEQQRQVRKKMSDRRVADQTAKKSPMPGRN